MDWGRAVEQLGSTGLFLFVLWSLANKWLGLFLKSRQEATVALVAQATAMAELAQTVKDGQMDQREVVIAVKVISSRLEEQRNYLKAIDENCRKNVCRAPGVL